MDDPDRLATLNHDGGGDLCGVEQLEHLAGDLLGPRGFRSAGHDVLDPGVKQVWPHVPAQVAVGNDADQLLTGIDDADATKTLAGNFDERFRHATAYTDQWNGIAPVHNIAHKGEHRPQLA